jgi:hypothetical protein
MVVNTISAGYFLLLVELIFLIGIEVIFGVLHILRIFLVTNTVPIVVLISDLWRLALACSRKKIFLSVMVW